MLCVVYQGQIQKKTWSLYQERVVSTWKPDSVFWYHDHLKKEKLVVETAIKSLTYGELGQVITGAIQRRILRIPFVRAAIDSVLVGFLFIVGFVVMICSNKSKGLGFGGGQATLNSPCSWN